MFLRRSACVLPRQRRHARGQADGYGGILRVQVMMEDGAISAVNILEQHETDGIGSARWIFCRTR